MRGARRDPEGKEDPRVILQVVQGLFIEYCVGVGIESRGREK